MISFLLSHPLYLPFIVLNIFIIYKVIQEVLNDEKEGDDEDDGGIEVGGGPKLDLPPGVTLPVDQREPVEV